MGDGVVISANTNGEETNYTYGLERISAQTGNRKTEYVYDGRGSVAAEVSYNNAWYTFGGAFSKKDVISKSYTPFGEQIGEQVSGFGYNGEYYNAATGMVYLRARFYEPAMNRFSQKDIVRGSITAPNSLNRYTYVQNDPINFIDPSGQSLKSAWNMVKSSVTNTVKNIVSNPVQAVKSVAKAVVNAVTHPIKTATNAAKSAGNAVRTIYNEVRTPDSQSKYASPATNRGTGSSYSGSSGGGAYTAPVYSPYDSNGNATSYNNSSYQSGKAPSPDAPRIEDVSPTSIFCNREDSEKIDTYIMFSNVGGSDFTDAANYQILKARREGKNVKVITVNTKNEFEAAWASLPESAAEVYMMFHSNGKSLIFEEGSPTEAASVNGQNEEDKPIGNLAELDHKSIDTLYLYACNSGNIDLAEKGDGIAELMSTITGGSVIGVDGELAYGAPSAFVSDEYNVFFPRLSQDQGGYHNYSGKFDSPEGFVEYRNGEFVGVVDGLPNSWEAIIHWAKLHEDNGIDELRDPG